MSTAAPITIDTTRPGVPLSRLIKVELRKMFNTRSGFWLMMSIAIVALLATIGCILFVPNDQLEYSVFGAAIGFPMALLLPVIAILAVTGEWSQRTGLITFTLVPHRASVIAAKAVASVIVGVVGMSVALLIGVVGNLAAAAINGVDAVWDFGVSDVVGLLVANVLGLLVGFMLGVLIRNTPGAIVGYVVYSFLLPVIFQLLAGLQDWFRDLRPWIDFNFAQGPLVDGGPEGEQWAHLATSGLIWLVIPLSLGVWAVLRSEVK
ncbi:ABC-2 transporter permease [Aeromicrobium fastidiosum]|uniref:ABC transporter permease subunit n=1 Tax=Aeromicrobium fastidiosum TaxID=52699 RepID=A0A641AL17_9ACTN|nr:ABC transporter permease subunit [Aeromicrobium fastidiosum]KAA1376517.1 ABC transporter permease subunit [Aeromicrobium fastidiosum]MBP2391566.1 putative membrane protein [Aeromicrobium fastidiosum]